MLLSRVHFWLAACIAALSPGLAEAATAAAVPAPISSDVFVTLHDAVAVRSRMVLLGEVAIVAAHDPAEQAEWAALEIAHPESLATPMHLTRRSIARRLASLRPEWRGQLLWGGSQEVVVSGQPQQVDLDPAVSKAAVFLLERLGGRDRVTLRLEEGGGRVSVPFGIARCSPDLQAANMIGAYAEVPVVVDVDGKPAMRQMLRFAVLRTSRRVDRAASAVEAETSAAADAVQPVQMPADASAYLVARQKPVTLLLDMDGIRIESEGIALDNARLGDLVRVRRANGNAEVSGKVVQQGVVQVGEAWE